VQVLATPPFCPKTVRNIVFKESRNNAKKDPGDIGKNTRSSRSNPWNQGIIWEKLFKKTDPISPTHLHLQAHQTITHPHQGIQIDRLIHLALLSSRPAILVLEGIHDQLAESSPTVKAV
tara:strand:- start:161 stop:517 length:357 start_codon:yes stop_codon:yes gene_type:complete